MKKLLSVSLLMCLAFFAKAQDLSASYDGRTVNAGDTITVVATGDELVFAPQFSNNGSQDVCCRLVFEKLNNTETVCTSVCTGALCMTGSMSAPFIIARFSNYTEAHAEFYVPQDAPASLFRVSCYDTLNTSSRVDFYLNVLNSNSHVGIDGVQNGKSVVSAYPNPATDVVNIVFPQCDDNSSVVLYNIAGSLVKKAVVAAGQTSASVNVSDLPAGVYFYGVRSKNGISDVRKLIVK